MSNKFGGQSTGASGNTSLHAIYYIGSINASVDIDNFQVISHEALRWFSFGLYSDISSGKLKLASALYCTGDLERCETLLGM
jgi:hypothetical protein